MDELLAAALRGHRSVLPDWLPVDAVIQRIAYHGVAGLLAEQHLDHWPFDVTAWIADRARRHGMWELRHRLVLGELLAALAAAGVRTLLLKGSALAYDLYEAPAGRERGDSDLLVRGSDLRSARETLGQLNFARLDEAGDSPEALRSQENWLLECEDGTRHVIDLHWQALNAPALHDLVPFEGWFAEARALPRLSEYAQAPSRPHMMLHACMHRGMHACAPYFVDGQTYFGGDRLIWLYDIALLARAMTEHDWAAVSRLASDARMARTCLDGLAAAEARFGALCPPEVRNELSKGPSSVYFRSGQLRRAVMDFWAVGGVRGKWQYLRSRSVPAAGFMRAKYPAMAGRPLPLLYARRFVDLLRPRSRA